MPRVLALVVAVSLIAPQPLHAQEPDPYDDARADADITLVLHASGDLYEAAHARLMAHPQLALDRAYLRTGTPASLTATERERLATLAEALAGTRAREQIMDPPLQIATTTPDPASPPPGPANDSLPVPKKPSGSPNSWRPVAVFGALFMAAGGLVTGVGAHALRQSHKPRVATPDPDGATDSKSCGCTAGVFVAGGALFIGAGVALVVSAVKSRRDWRAYQRRQAVAVAPSFGRSARGTFTTGLELRF